MTLSCDDICHPEYGACCGGDPEAARRKGLGMSEKPIWLLDIDGVVNALSMKPPAHIWPTAAWTRMHVNGFQVTAARQVVEFIKAVHDDGRAEVRWHTTWQDRALDFGAALGLPEFEVQYTDEWPDSGERAAQRILAGYPNWWKYPAVYRLLATGRKVLWTDDDIFESMPAVHRQNLKKVGKVRMVCPTGIYGLQPGELRQIDKFLKEWNR